MARRKVADGEGSDDRNVGGTHVVYRTAGERDDDTDLSMAVIDALAEAKDVQPVDIQRPLYDVVDPDALDRLFTSTGGDGVSGRVVFELAEHEITVRSDGDIVVRRIDTDEKR